jgi:hypothetical protein
MPDMPDKVTWTHDGLLRDLATHLRANTARMVWTDMQLGPSGSPRPDVYTLDKSYQHPRPVSYEVKVSVADFRSDVTSGKWQTYLPFSCAVIFAMPAGLVPKTEVPRECGIIYRHDAVWRMARAPVLQRVTLPQNVLLKLLIDGVGRLFESRTNAREFHTWDLARKHRQRLGQDVCDAVTGLDDVRRRVEMAREQAEEILANARKRAETAQQRETEATARLKRVLARVMGSDQDTNTPIDKLANDVAEKVEQRLAALDADVELQRMRRALEEALSTLGRVAASEPKHIPYWYRGREAS